MESNLKTKKIYLSPNVQQIILDNCISLALESSPPAGPSEVNNQAPHYFNAEPFKNSLA